MSAARVMDAITHACMQETQSYKSRFRHMVENLFEGGRVGESSST